MIAAIETCRTVDQIPVATSLRALGLSSSWFYKHRAAGVTARQERSDRLDQVIREIFDRHDGTYGSPRVRDDLVEMDSWRSTSVNTIAKSMRRCGLAAKTRRHGRSLTRPDVDAPKFVNLLNRDFDPPTLNRAWVGDITEIVTWEGKIYVATVIELWSRRLIGWAIGHHMDASLVIDALEMAIDTRGGHVGGVIFHSDRGSQYTAKSFVSLCQHHQITQSMSRAGCCLDNAVAESFFATLKNELVYRCVLVTVKRTTQLLEQWFTRYNMIRRHSYCGGIAPAVFEQRYTQARATAA
jgi:putative transposase